MEIFIVPYFNGNDTILSVIQIMHESQSFAIMIVLEQQKLLYTSKVVFRGYSAGLDFCNQLDINLGIPLLDINKLNITNRNIQDLLVDFRQRTSTEKIMDRGRFDYATVTSTESEGKSLSFIITRDEIYKTLISGTNVICVCTGPGRHLVEGDLALDGQKCRTCRKLYKCTTSH
ncbi:hypothetical protein QNI16_24045 [Cytophagaceae bacterium YF14B1]|uniref:Uncharacterized protein n=1 Tax=Xanthocytophaga flava TaxID=3048013 RepID=A0AAE3QQF7_9BACT|nr:hypothetical protein [Xanthocytophaga flavus]MDJ1483592.1 hypothetical protein [Xanthocytophaga flavus]